MRSLLPCPFCSCYAQDTSLSQHFTCSLMDPRKQTSSKSFSRKCFWHASDNFLFMTSTPYPTKLLFGTQLQRTPVLFAPSSRSNTKISLTYPATQAVIRWQNSCSMIFFHVISGKIHLRISKCALQIKKSKKGFLWRLWISNIYPCCPKSGMSYWIQSKY